MSDHHARAFQDPGTPEEVSRRKFLTNATIVLGNVMALAVAVPVVVSLIPKRELIDANKGWTPLDQAEFAKLQRSTDTPVKLQFTRKIVDGYEIAIDQEYVWGVKMTQADADKMKVERPELFAHRAPIDFDVVAMGFTMWSPICPHLGCKYDWDSSVKLFVCPCHASKYDTFGKHVGGPAPRGLDPLPFREESGKAEVEWMRYQAGVPDIIRVSFT